MECNRRGRHGVAKQGKIVDYLAQNGFKTGARWSDTDKENLEFSVLADFDDVAWISINKFGCLAQIEIRQTTPKPAITNNTVITNVKAKKAGIIVSVTALGGWQAVEPERPSRPVICLFRAFMRAAKTRQKIILPTLTALCLQKRRKKSPSILPVSKRRSHISVLKAIKLCAFSVCVCRFMQ